MECQRWSGSPTRQRITSSRSAFVDQRPYVVAMEDRLSLFSPGPDRGGRVMVKGYGWESQLEHCQMWLRSLRSEVETVSLWDTLGSGAARELGLATFSDRKLSKEQQKEIAVRVQRVRVYLRSNVEDREALRRIEAKLTDLEDASKRLGTKDFANVALGALISIGMEAALDAHKAQEMVNLFLGGLRALLGG